MHFARLTSNVVLAVLGVATSFALGAVGGACSSKDPAVSAKPGADSGAGVDSGAPVVEDTAPSDTAPWLTYPPGPYGVNGGSADRGERLRPRTAQWR